MALTVDLIEEARRFLAGRVRRTPLEESPALSKVVGAPVFLKLENLQATGSFKLRGALFRLSLLSEDEKRAGISTCSGGNHGKAVAYAAKALGLTPTITVPSSVDEAKHRAMVALGADVVVSRFPGYDDTEVWAMEQAAKAGKVWISAFDDDAIMAGNGGSLAAEILEDLPEARSFVLPVGGGGLGAGLALYVKEKSFGAVIVGCNHELSPALALSLERGEAVTRLPAAETSAGGIEGGIGKKPFDVLRSRVDRVALLSEAEIFEAVRWMLDVHQYVIEPSAAAAVAACLTGKAGRLQGPAVIVLTGRNVSLQTLRRILQSA
ncbi:MAG: threonine ammonia-lyase [Thermoanaerobaculia bacterium]